MSRESPAGRIETAALLLTGSNGASIIIPVDDRQGSEKLQALEGRREELILRSGHEASLAEVRREVAESKLAVGDWRDRAEAAEAEVARLHAQNALLLQAAGRWQHARRILPICAIEEANDAWLRSNRQDEEQHNLKADAAIDAAVGTALPATASEQETLA